MASRLPHLLTALALAGLLGAGDAGARSGPDPFFPRSGNPGYDVSSYEVHLSYRPTRGTLRATTAIEAISRRPLRRFALDLVGLEVTSVEVDGRRAAFSRGRGKLRIQPQARLAAGRRFKIVVHYRGRPRQVTDPDGSTEGWHRTEDGALGVGEPVGTAAWIPCDNSLRDKAAFHFLISVPGGLKAVANGRLLGVSRHAGRTVFEWSERQPMAPYLAVIDIGRGRLTRSRLDGVPAWTFTDARLPVRSLRAIRALPEIVRFESGIYGTYPFDSAGSIVDPTDLGYALESQTRPIYDAPPNRTTVVHETAHQWFGDSVGLMRWPEIWLNEGFATWTQWYYAEHHGGTSALQTFRKLYRTPAAKTAFWNPPPARPGTAKNLFATSTYVRGAMALEALRIKIGTATMLEALRSWATAHRYGIADVHEFIALAEGVSGHRLGPLFQRWLYRPGKP